MRALEFITGHLIYNPAYTYKFQLKTTKAILKTSSIDVTPYNLQFHMKKVHPQLVWKFYEATKLKRKRKRLWIPDEG